MAQSLSYNDQATTPNRQLRVAFDVDRPVVLRPAMGETRTGEQIARGSNIGIGDSFNVLLGPDGRWKLRHAQADISNLNELIEFRSAILRKSLFQLAGPHSEFPVFRTPTDIPGITPDPSVVQDQGDWFIRREFTAGVAAGEEFTSDALQYPKPPPCLGTHVPVDRVAIGLATHSPNSGFHLRFITPGTQLHAQDVVCCFYFGGRVNTYSGVPGGVFAVVFFGNGEALLWETVGGYLNWIPRLRFTYSAPSQVAGRTHAITIQPQGRNKILFYVATSDRALPAGQGAATSPVFQGAPPNPHYTKYETNSEIAGYIPGNTTTGMGNVRLDVRRDLLLAWQVSVVTYPAQGVLVDYPFSFQLPISMVEKIRMDCDAVVPEGCTFTPFLYQADDLDASSPLVSTYLGGASWEFLSVPYVTDYYALFFMESNSVNDTSPSFGTYSVEVDAVIGNQAGLNIYFPQDQTDELHVSITGQDGDLTHETASMRMINQDGTLVIPRRRSRIRTRVELAYLEAGGTEVQLCYLFDGQSIAIERTPFGYPDGEFHTDGIDPLASTYDGQFAGVWARGHESYSFRRVPFYGEDKPFAYDILTGRGSSVKVTDVIRKVFRSIIGVPDDMLDIPDLPVPLIPTPGNENDLMLQPKQNPLEYAAHLAKDYLGWWLMWDRNAINRGRWRIRPQVDLYGPQSDPLWNFQFGPAEYDGKDPIAPETYGDQHTWIERDSYSDWPEAPEYNFVWVIAPGGENIPADGGKFKYQQIAWNPASFDIDPLNPTASPDINNPDYVGEMLPLIIWDVTIGQTPPEEGGPQGAVDSLAFLTINQVGHARKWFRFRAPLVLAFDHTDPYLFGRRPLRHNDPIMIGGVPAILKSVNIEDCKADWQFAWYQGVFSTFPTP